MYQNALEGVRVVDFTWVVAGPFCTKLLALMGAEVIKVESSTRPQYKDRGGCFPLLNNSKKSCTINLATAEGKALVKRLIAASDVVVENFSPGAMDRLGLGYEALKAIKKDLIYVSASGVGHTGPGKSYPAYGCLLQGLSGWTSLFGGPNPRMEGMGVTPSWTDPITGSWETLIIQAALMHRFRTGEGLRVDLSMLESTIAVMGDVFLGAAVPGSLPPAGQSSGYSHAVPHGIYPCKGDDSWIAISVESQAEWEGLCRTLGDPPWCREEGLLTLTARQQNRRRIDDLLAAWTSRLPVQELFHRLQAAGVPAGPCYSLEQVVEDPQMKRRGLFRRLPVEDGNPQTTTVVPWSDGSAWKGNLRKAPSLGEHTQYVCRQLLGMSEDEYQSLRREGILQ